jgi:hypothetical protein
METKLFTLSSPVFSEGSIIPDKYTCKGEGISPPLSIKNIPDEANSLALFVHDPDAPQGDFLHWAMWNISPNTANIDEDLPPVDVIEGMNDFGQTGYGSPCPPSGSHRYIFDLYALSDPLNLHLGTRRQELEQALRSLAITKTTLTGIVIA